MADTPDIRSLTDADVPAVLALWSAAFPETRPWNQPAAYLARKRAQGDDLLLVAELGGRVAGAVVVGWDGARGWIYHLAVDPSLRRHGVGRALMHAAEERLRARGCPKVNLQVLPDNRAAVAFYESLGYAVEPRISMGRTLA